ncbi:MAG: hypothetical protein K2P84_02130 [Undibacterium sp.]|nr:hypothetical protein [Undibacterium sp.]
MHFDDTSLPNHDWIMLETPAEFEGWIEFNNQELQNLIKDQNTVGQGICLNLALGGTIYLHTNSDGDLLLDVSTEASWVSPVISACTGISAPRGQIWLLPGHVNVPLLMGLNSLIASSSLVLKHQFRGR